MYFEMPTFSSGFSAARAREEAAVELAQLRRDAAAATNLRAEVERLRSENADLIIRHEAFSYQSHQTTNTLRRQISEQERVIQQKDRQLNFLQIKTTAFVGWWQYNREKSKQLERENAELNKTIEKLRKNSPNASSDASSDIITISPSTPVLSVPTSPMNDVSASQPPSNLKDSLKAGGSNFRSGNSLATSSSMYSEDIEKIKKDMLRSVKDSEAEMESSEREPFRVPISTHSGRMASSSGIQKPATSSSAATSMKTSPIPKPTASSSATFSMMTSGIQKPVTASSSASFRRTLVVQEFPALPAPPKASPASAASPMTSSGPEPSGIPIYTHSGRQASSSGIQEPATSSSAASSMMTTSIQKTVTSSSTESLTMTSPILNPATPPNRKTAVVQEPPAPPTPSASSAPPTPLAPPAPPARALPPRANPARAASPEVKVVGVVTTITGIPSLNGKKFEQIQKEWKEDDTRDKHLDQSHFHTYLFNPKGDPEAPQIVRKPHSGYALYVNWRVTFRNESGQKLTNHNESWKLLGKPGQKPWKDDLGKVVKEQQKQIENGWIQLKVAEKRKQNASSSGGSRRVKAEPMDEY